jgi:hypothetical protein
MSPVRYELGSYIPKDDILHNHGRENFKSYGLEIHLYNSENKADFDASIVM